MVRWASLSAAARDELSKLAAEITTPLLPHQERVLKRIESAPGLVVAHGLGTGKTLSSIAAGLQEGGATAAVPASLRANYAKEIAKHVVGDPGIDVVSLQGGTVGEGFPTEKMLIVDEAHRARDPRSKTFAAVRESPASKKLLLTGSPVYNRPEDIAPLVNIAAGEDVLPMGRGFRTRYVRGPGQSVLDLIPFVHTRAGIRHKGELSKKMAPWVDYYGDVSNPDFPKTTENVFKVPMTEQQSQLHAAAWGSLPPWAKAKIRAGLPPTKAELAAINKFEAQTRQISGSVRSYTAEGVPEPTPKVQQAFTNFSEKLQTNPEHKALIYSNYKAPLQDYEELLKKQSVPYAVFSGDQTMNQRKQIVDDYNAGKIKALLVTSAGGEGLDLRGTRQVQVLEPHWNEEKIKQVVGRAVRRGSHTDLPEDQRNVEVQRYVSYPTSRIFHAKKPGIETYLSMMSEDKERLNQQMRAIMEAGTNRFAEAGQ